jgi:hypothetical protein
MDQHKTMKVWGWIAALLFAPIGIVLGLMLRKRGQSIGTWIAAVSALVCVIAVASAAGGSDPNPGLVNDPDKPEAAQEADATETPDLPVVTLEVVDGKTVHRDSVKVTGSVSPANSDVVIEGDSDSIEAKVKHGRFSATVRELGVGDNDVTVTASAPDHEDASHDLTVTRKRSHAELLALARAKAERKRRAAQRRREAALRRAYGRALDKAEDYLSYSAFSKQGLYEQLSSDAGEGFTEAEARYAVEHVHANWKQQAVKKAKDYLDYQSFSRQGLYEQLSSSAGEGFTPEEAQYAVSKVY